jgi:hypothetical protein
MEGIVARLFETAKEACEIAGFSEAARAISLAIQTLGDFRNNNLSAIKAELKHVAESIIWELTNRKFLSVDPKRCAYLDNEALLGDSVAKAFGSAIPDIKEAGNALAAECNTAAVFHLMRVAEVGLRTLAWDRRVKVINNKGRIVPFDLATWDEIIKELEKAETAIQGFKKTHAREEQFQFYHGAMMEFKRFKNVWRNRIMHARDEHYDANQAQSVFEHVKAFMQILATKISETKRMPIAWQKP